jgi:hypothetical protein
MSASNASVIEGDIGFGTQLIETTVKFVGVLIWSTRRILDPIDSIPLFNRQNKDPDRPKKLKMVCDV